MKLKKILTSVCAAVIGTAALAFDTGAGADTAGSMRDITTMELVRDMGIGINLGNTMESSGDWIAEVNKQWGSGILTTKDYETAWGSPVITEPMIKGMANEGFGVCRVPVAWSNMMSDDGTYTINSDYMDRVKQIADWVIGSGMYCIINIHWDNGWVNKFPENKEESMRRYETMWNQIADGFENYGDHLIFESQNEELGWDSIWNQWSGTASQKADSYSLVNEVNQKFVDVIRSSGGNNPERHLLISGYNTSIDLTCDPLFKMPNDPKGRCAVSVHYYTPAGFAILEDEDTDWAKARSTWGTSDDYAELSQQMDLMKTTYIDKGIPVIIGEYGCPTKGKEASSVRTFLSSVCKAAYDRQMCPVLWSVTGEHYDRTTCQIIDKELKAEYDKIRGTSDPVTPSTEPTEQLTEPVQTTELTVQPTEPNETTDPTEPTESFKKGDVNHDHFINADDVRKMSGMLTKKSAMPSDNEFAHSDINGDGKINVIDLLMLKRMLVKGRSLY